MLMPSSSFNNASCAFLLRPPPRIPFGLGVLSTSSSLVSGENDKDFFTEAVDFGLDDFEYEDRKRGVFFVLDLTVDFEPSVTLVGLILGDFGVFRGKLERNDEAVLGLESDLLLDLAAGYDSLGGADLGRRLWCTCGGGVFEAFRALSAHAKHLALGRSFQE